MPQLWVAAGPNGAGKSTLTRRYLVGRLPIVDPDAIARELDPPDPTRVRVRVQAGREAIHQRRRLLLSMERGQVKHRSRNLPRWAHHALPPTLLQDPALDC